MKKHMIIGAALAAAGIAQAATITWNASTTAYAAGNETAWISQDGTLLNAINASDSVNATVTYGGVDWNNTDATEIGTGVTQNGITISSPGTSYAGAFGPGQFSDTEQFYNGGLYSFSSLVLSGLTEGQEYQLQIMGIDDRGTDVRNTILGDGTQDYAASVTAGTAGNILLRTNPAGEGSFAIGTFIADATGTQTISVYGNRNSDLTQSLSLSTSQFNALQLRAIPEPATLGLLSFIGAGLIFIRRRFMI